jgi:hypothetical protein
VTVDDVSQDDKVDRRLGKALVPKLLLLVLPVREAQITEVKTKAEKLRK